MADTASHVCAAGSGTAPAVDKHSQMRENSVKLIDQTFSARDVLTAVAEDIGKENILGCVKVGLEWVLTVSSKSDAELLQSAGLVVGGKPCDVRGVTKSLITASIFGVPTFISDEDLTEKLTSYGCKLRSDWTHKKYEDFPSVDNGIRYARIELPANTKSLPYSILISGIHLRVKHNGQTRVCNLCLEDNHLMRECAQYVCKECKVQGHSESKCPKVKCYRCQGLGHKSFNCELSPDTEMDQEANPSKESEDSPPAVAAPDPKPLTDPPQPADTQPSNNELSKTTTASNTSTGPQEENVEMTETLNKRGRESSSDEYTWDEIKWQVVQRNPNKKKFVPNLDTARVPKSIQSQCKDS
ncbi:hypothetical protein HOLleu_35844 [Holothuria leucospilota]|uniref:CCHC-type domain-containing protein n=1 Tax=Holothuria leucospilota TaxID=206669 RepID=A0A9Q1BFN1_HOLLE|nr:hypothetical protein HOLleu_35844 [Holothuria leucospilota]